MEDETEKMKLPEWNWDVWFSLITLILFFSIIGGCSYLDAINRDTGFQYFKNLEFGTDLDVIVAPHGIYTDKYVNFHKFTKFAKFENFVSEAERLNVTVYWEGYNGRRFWFYVHSSGFYFEAPFKLLPDNNMRNTTW